MTARTGRSRVRPHLHVTDDGIPADYRGFRRCSTCGLMGAPGDKHHPEVSPTVPPRQLPTWIEVAAQEREAAILGEREDHE